MAVCQHENIFSQRDKYGANFKLLVTRFPLTPQIIIAKEARRGGDRDTHFKCVRVVRFNRIELMCNSY